MCDRTLRTYEGLAAALVLALLVLQGCAGTHAPQNWLPSVDELGTDAYGLWLEVEFLDNGKEMKAGGEFISVQDSVVYILPPRSTTYGISKADITWAYLDIHQNQVGPLIAWTAVGALSTLSHGFFLIISAPVWVVVGSLSAAAVSHEGRYAESHPTNTWWREMSGYSRFPQGVPAGLDLKSLIGKRENQNAASGRP